MIANFVGGRFLETNFSILEIQLQITGFLYGMKDEGSF